MRFVLRSAAKDLRRRSKDPLALASWMGIPAGIGLLLSLMGGGSTAPETHVLIADQDGTFVSGLFANAGSFTDALTTESVTVEDGRRRLDAGEASGLVIVPKGFQEAVLQKREVTLTLVKNPSQQILPKVIEEGLEITSELIFYVQEQFGEELAALGSGPPSDALMVSINQAMQSLEGVVFPPVLVLETETATGQELPSFGYLFLPGILMMAMMFVTQGMSEDLWKEKELGTLRRALVAPASIAGFLLGKVAASAALVGAVSVVGVVVGVLAFGLPLSAAPMAVLWCCFAGAAIFPLFASAQLLASTSQAGSMLTNVLLFPLIMVGGSFFPFEAMPTWMASAGGFTPNGRALLVLKDVLSGTATVGSTAAALLALFLPAAVLFSWNVRRLARFAIS